MEVTAASQRFRIEALASDIAKAKSLSNNVTIDSDVRGLAHSAIIVSDSTCRCTGQKAKYIGQTADNEDGVVPAFKKRYPNVDLIFLVWDGGTLLNLCSAAKALCQSTSPMLLQINWQGNEIGAPKTAKRQVEEGLKTFEELPDYIRCGRISMIGLMPLDTDFWRYGDNYPEFIDWALPLLGCSVKRCARHLPVRFVTAKSCMGLEVSRGHIAAADAVRLRDIILQWLTQGLSEDHCQPPVGDAWISEWGVIA